MNKPTSLKSLPRTVISADLVKHAEPGEPIIVLKMLTGNNGSFRFSGRGSKVYLFKSREGMQEFKVPLSIWEMEKLAMARDILEQKLFYPIIVTVELPKEADEKPKKHYPKPKPDKERAETLTSNFKPEDPSGLTIGILREAIRNLDSKTRASELAKMMDVPLDTIKELAAKPESNIEIASGGWIALKK